MEPHISYLVVGTPRSGSSLLCEKLRDTGVAGRPEEYFVWYRVPEWEKKWGVSSIEEYVAAAIRHGTTSNGVFGAKLLWEQWYETLLPRLRAVPHLNGVSEARLLDTLFPHLHYILIRRQDRLRQAISWEKAYQTNVWMEHHEGASRGDSPEPVFDHDAISRRMRTLDKREDDWWRIFREAGVVPTEVIYEELVDSPEPVIRSVLEQLDIDAPQQFNFVPRLKRQSDEINEEWVDVYQAIEGGARIMYVAD